MAQSNEAIGEVKWTPELEVALFHSMHGLKPVGLNKNFHMVCIQAKLQQSVGLLLTTKQIWQHLRSMYDLDSLESLEMLPLLNEEKEFSLPGYILGELEGGDEESLVGGTRSQYLCSSLSPASSPAAGRSGSKRRKN